MMKKNLLIVCLAVSSVFLLFRQDYTLSETMREELKLYMGTNQTISVNNPTRIAIGNPAVADVGMVSKKELTLSPKSAGATTLIVWDNFGEQSYLIKVFLEDTKKIKSRVDNVLAKLNLPGLSTKAEDEEAKIFLTGKLDNAQEKERINLALGGLKKYVVDLTTLKEPVEDESVVEIDVQVLELNKGVSDTLGFTWPDSITITDVAGGATNSWAKLFKLGEMTRSAAYSLKLDMLIREGKARVLSRPRLACLSGKEAKLLVGGEVPILSSSVTGGGTSGTVATPGSVEYKEYGIKLNIKPTVKPNGRIYLNLGVEVSEVGTTAVSTSYALAYPFTKRTANTELYLNDGQTMAIGGLIKQKTEEELRKLPWLADVPVLGLFFRQRTLTKGGGATSRSDSELFITLTPTIVSELKEPKVKLEPKTELTALPLDEDSLDPVTRYSRIIQQRIVENINYPSTGQGAGFQGTVKLSLKFSYRGELLEAKIKDSSGYKVLDDNALRTAKNISSYPPFPPAITSQDLWVEVPIVYKLD